MRRIFPRLSTHIKKAAKAIASAQAGVGARTLKPGHTRYFVGYKKHTLRLWLSHYKASKLLVPVSTWAAPANRGEALFLHPGLSECHRRLRWLPEWVVVDKAYISFSQQRRIREEMGVGVVVKLRADMHLQEPYSGPGIARCPQGQRLQWLHYDSADQEQWFGAASPSNLCKYCWEQARCPREFAFPAKNHEILFGKVPLGSWLARHLTEEVRHWVEPAQSFEKNQLGLSAFFLNSLQLTWIMCLLADMVVLLRTHALLCSPKPENPLGDLTPEQLQISL